MHAAPASRAAASPLVNRFALLNLSTTPTSDERLLVRIEGELSAESGREAEHALHPIVEAADATIDLAQAAFVDLGSVRMLVGCRERARASGHELEIVNAPAYVQRMLEMLDRGHYWRPESFARRHESGLSSGALTTTTEAQRSRPGSEQVVRVQCGSCGYVTFRPEGTAAGRCLHCAGELHVAAVFRDHRRRA
jgi:anti-anti-sigma factor